MRPPKPSFAVTRVIKASRVLTPAMKLVWLEDYALDRGPKGCYMTHANLGACVGLPGATVEKYRRAFVRVRLHAVVRQNGERGSSWYCAVPEDCVPCGKDVGPDEIERRARLLDEYFLSHKPGRTAEVNPDHRPTLSDSKPGPTSDSLPEARSGGRGEEGPLTSSSFHTLQPPNSNREKRLESGKNTQEPEVGGPPDDATEFQRAMDARMTRLRDASRVSA